MTQDFKAKVIKEAITYTDPFEMQAFEDGVCFALNNIWHEPKEKPKVPSRILTVYGLIADSWDYTGTKYSDDILNCCHKWCYLEDILPKEK